MTKMVFISLPVKDVAASTAFYQAIGFEKNEAFSNEQGAAMKWSDTVSFMLVSHDFYATLTTRPIADTQLTSAALIALSFDSKAGVDRITEAAIAAGGAEAHEPDDQGFMYSRAFWDLDGHAFGPMWMDMAAMASAGADAEATA